MIRQFNPYEDSINILRESTSSVFEKHEIAAMLEDVNSPVRMKYNQKIYDAVLNKKHIDFDDISRSAGDINQYVGIKSMKDTLKIIRELDVFQKTDVLDYVKTIEEAIANIESLRSVYQQGFTSKSDYVMMEYNALVYACVEATTTILYEFVDFIKKPGIEPYTIVLKNTKYRANLHFIEQLEKYNNVNRNMLSDYRKFLLSFSSKDGENFIGSSMAIGLATISAVALAIVPVTRTLIYNYYNNKRRLADYLEYQAHFLEMNRAVVESNGSFTLEKKKKILDKQEKIRQRMIRLSDTLRVNDVKTHEKTKRDLDTENKTLKASAIRKEIDDSPLQLL